eukprot:1445571-Rhodomonas_salina.1
MNQKMLSTTQIRNALCGRVAWGQPRRPKCLVQRVPSQCPASCLSLPTSSATSLSNKSLKPRLSPEEGLLPDEETATKSKRCAVVWAGAKLLGTQISVY